jgi:hypothetical protein
MKDRWLEPASDADEKQEARFETWLCGEGIPFYKGCDSAQEDSRENTHMPFGRILSDSICRCQHV